MPPVNLYPLYPGVHGKIANKKTDINIYYCNSDLLFGSDFMTQDANSTSQWVH